MKNTRFTLELCGSCVRTLDASVLRAIPKDGREAAAMAAGQRIREGGRSIDDLHIIAFWKAPRAAHHIYNPKNTRDRVANALNIATAASESVELKVEELIGLVGVGVPMASAILTCIDPTQYTVIDIRALDALRVEKYKITKELYAEYLEFCRSAAANLGVELRQLDRALWKSGSIY